MIVKYIDRAMSKAVYDKLDDGSFSGKISTMSRSNCIWKNPFSM